MHGILTDENSKLWCYVTNSCCIVLREQNLATRLRELLVDFGGQYDFVGYTQRSLPFS